MNNRKLRYDELKSISQTHETLPRFPLYVLLENTRSLYNVGSIFRTADGLRAEKVILTGYTGRPPRREIDKAALGAVEAVPWTAYDSTLEAVSELKNHGVAVIGLEQTTSSVDYRSYTYTLPAAVILGNEYDGIEQDTLDECDVCVHIPMAGIKQSLNVSTAFGIIGYEILRQVEFNSQHDVPTGRYLKNEKPDNMRKTPGSSEPVR